MKCKHCKKETKNTYIKKFKGKFIEEVCADCFLELTKAYQSN